MARRKIISRYEVIAADLAAIIKEQIYEEGTLLKGRSVLAGKYKVSPETVRKSIGLLEEHGIVKSVANMGIMVTSREKAAQYAAENSLGSAVTELEKKLQDLLSEKQKIEEEIAAAIQTLLVLAGLHKQDLHG